MTQKNTWSYWIGGIKVESSNIDELRGLVEGIEQSKSKGTDLPKKLSDFIFAVCVDYQTYYGLEEDDYEIKNN